MPTRCPVGSKTTVPQQERPVRPPLPTTGSCPPSPLGRSESDVRASSGSDSRRRTSGAPARSSLGAGELTGCRYGDVYPEPLSGQRSAVHAAADGVHPLGHPGQPVAGSAQTHRRPVASVGDCQLHVVVGPVQRDVDIGVAGVFSTLDSASWAARYNARPASGESLTGLPVSPNVTEPRLASRG